MNNCMEVNRQTIRRMNSRDWDMIICMEVNRQTIRRRKSRDRDMNVNRQTLGGKGRQWRLSEINKGEEQIIVPLRF